MKRLGLLIFAPALLLAGCRHSATQAPKPAAYGTQIVEVSGGKQLAQLIATATRQFVDAPLQGAALIDQCVHAL